MPVDVDIFGDALTSPMEIGLPVYQAPFLPVDTGTYLYYVTYWQLQSSYSTTLPDLGDSGPYGGVYAGTSAFRDVAGGVIEFVREYAILPATRNEYESYVHGYQVVVSGEITELPKTTSTRIQYDYFASGVPITLDKAPRVLKVGTTLYFLYGWGSLVVGDEYLAEDATYKIWKGNIYERTQRFYRAEYFAP